MSAYSAIPYDQARDLIQDGDIVFIADHKGPVSAVIETLTKSMFSHCNIAFWVEIGGEKRLLCVEAQGGTKRRIVNLSYYQSNGSKFLYVVTPPKAWKDVAGVALEKLGQADYSYLEALYVGFREFLLKYFNIKLKEVDLKGEICSEFIARVYELNNKVVSPQLLFEELMETQEIRMVISL